MIRAKTDPKDATYRPIELVSVKAKAGGKTSEPTLPPIGKRHAKNYSHMSAEHMRSDRLSVSEIHLNSQRMSQHTLAPPEKLFPIQRDVLKEVRNLDIEDLSHFDRSSYDD